MNSYQTRQNVFETNSSSTHSITMGKDTELYDVLPVNQNGDLAFGSNSFGWDINDFNDPITKAQYALAYASWWPRTKDLIVSVLLEQTGARKIYIDGKDINSYDWNGPIKLISYGQFPIDIDHQSVEEGNFHHIFTNAENIRDFIFNPHWVLHTDNDNH